MNSVVANVITTTINNLDTELRDLSVKIHDYPELGYKEYKASRLLEDYLEKNGFHVTREASGMATAFIAEYSNSTNGRKVAFCSEYDALPTVGHACGHNLIAITGVACAMAMKTLLEKNLIAGTVTLFGTPSEENEGGKITFVHQHEFQNRADFAVMLHPAPSDSIIGPALAIDALKVEYFGKASHAGMAPWNGINALDALMQGWNNVSMLRQQTIATNRIHGVIRDGGNSPNVIPDYASASFLARSVSRKQLSELKYKLEDCFKAAAVATGCQVKLSWIARGPVDDLFTNYTLGNLYQHYMEDDEGVVFPPSSQEQAISAASSDFGNVSYVLPSIQPIFKIKTDGPNHTLDFAKAAGTPEAHQSALRAARSMSKTAATVYLDSDVYENAWAEFRKGKPE